METNLDMERAYQELRPVFLHALAHLARHGLAVSPADGVDLIHEFFAQKWDDLARNYQPDKGTLRQYAYQSFVYFARPQILKLRRIQDSLVDMNELDHSPAVEVSVSPHDQHVLLNAISTLPEFQKSVLCGYIYADSPSERKLASNFGLTRHRLHEELVAALGRVVVMLDRPEAMPEKDWQVAQALWRDFRTFQEAAGSLGITSHQVRQANSRNMRLLSEALQEYKPKGQPGLRRRTIMKQQRQRTVQSLLKDTLMSADNRQLLNELAQRSNEVLAALEKPAEFGISDEDVSKMSPFWIAEVYEVLSKADADFREHQGELPDLNYAHEDEEFSIGAAYRDCLIADLPYELRTPEVWLSAIEKVDQQEKDYALSTPSVRGGLDATASLAEFGITPLMIVRAIQAVSYLLERFMRKGKIDPQANILLRCLDNAAEQSVDARMLVGEIRRMAECREAAARALYDWQIRVAEYKPKLFDGFHAKPEKGAVLLTRTNEHFENLIDRWSWSASVFISVN